MPGTQAVKRSSGQALERWSVGAYERELPGFVRFVRFVAK
jgi:hypothetical protein